MLIKISQHVCLCLSLTPLFSSVLLFRPKDWHHLLSILSGLSGFETACQFIPLYLKRNTVSALKLILLASRSSWVHSCLFLIGYIMIANVLLSVHFTSDNVVSCIPFQRELGPFGTCILSKNLRVHRVAWYEWMRYYDEIALGENWNTV